ncbi:ubiquinone/menaquinone biosynthesis methyltransferase, putative [Ixodes scapularis]|uniref:Ubiquinone/menaquinone biosynthesis methyltransferase, putative n=1 Tax=Ixodes scapularis TaxID=6945 RepID=B7P4J4_IXOSC|nr:ubiquinone/menaquinone biosynthesis methyltransferase, putative [Ixodes scapularis]|eukprot:XP_002406094.1 ubiquinone/menaquinone biosynthesis methyltransferase, putative [Ixodes scapularis]
MIATNHVYDSYSFQVIPVMGLLLARDWKSYQYLVESIRKFPSQHQDSWLVEERSRAASRMTLTIATSPL